MKKIFLTFFFCFFTLFSYANQPSIVFIHLGNTIPEYLPTAISQARIFNEKSPIYLILNRRAYKKSESVLKQEKVKIVFYENLRQSPEHIRFKKKSTLDKKFRSGFWAYASERFFSLDDFMHQFEIEDVFHLENDNMLYADLNEILPIVKSRYPGIAATFDNDLRCVPGIIYFSNPKAIHKLIQYMVLVADHGLNDMEMIGQFGEISSSDVIDHLPVVSSDYSERHHLVSQIGEQTKKPERYSNHFNEFSCLFDAACIGQYLGGIDKRNGESKVGFINESSLYNPQNFDHFWKVDARGRKVPYIGFYGKQIPYINLHIHSKNLKEFCSYPNQQNRDTSYPYISGDTFRSFADHVYDETMHHFFPKYVLEGDVVFVKTDYIDIFLSQYHPKIENPYILITHNSDKGITKKYQKALDDSKILAWFSQNIEFDHSKLHPIPIGIANQYWCHGNVKRVQKIFQKKLFLEKKYSLYMNFQQLTFPERVYVNQLFQKKSYIYKAIQKKYELYLQDLVKSKFVLSPRGNGLDCHRTWETLLMGAFPIVKTSPLDKIYEGLPVWIVQNWEDVNQEMLDKKYLEFTSKEFYLERLFADYWFDQIRSFKPKEKAL